MRKGLLVGLPFFTAFGGFMFVYALSLQDGAGLSPLRTGLILLPMALVFLATSLSVARLLARFGRRVLVAGGLIDAAGMVVLGVGLSASWPHPSGLALVPGMMIVGLGQGLLMSPIFGVLLSDVPAHLAGAGSGVTATMQQSSLALGVATVGSAYLTLTGHIGALHATLLILGVLTAILVLVAGLCVRLLRTSPSAHPSSAPAATALLDSTSAIDASPVGDADDDLGLVPLHI